MNAGPTNGSVVDCDDFHRPRPKPSSEADAAVVSHSSSAFRTRLRIIHDRPSSEQTPQGQVVDMIGGGAEGIE